MGLLDSYVTALSDFKDTILAYRPSGWCEFHKVNGDLDVIQVRQISSAGYDIQLDGKVCNLTIDPANSNKIKKMHIDFISGIKYFATKKTSNPSDDYDDCTINMDQGAVFNRISTLLNNTFNTNIRR